MTMYVMRERRPYLIRTSENPLIAKFRERPFHALG
jgi:hypothetical protein